MMTSNVGIAGQRMLVVGAAKGIGNGIASRLAGEGVEVVVLDRDLEGVREFAHELRGEGATVHPYHLDLTDEASVTGTVERVVAEVGVPQGVVNSAGIAGPTGLNTEDITPVDFDAVLGVNLRGAYLLSRAVLPRLAEVGYGRVVQVASIAGKDGNPGMLPYTVSKAGLIGMVKAQGKEYARTGVTINAVAPAVVLTDLVAALPEETVDYMTSRIPMGRCGEIAEIAELVAWMVSPACSYTTGFTFDASGGRATY